MHGSQEIPQFTHDLFQHLRLTHKKVILGIEVPEDEQSLVDNFLNTKDRGILKKSKFFVRSLQDGRSSEAMVKLLEDLPKNSSVICFDSPKASSGQERDQQMAANLIKVFKKLKPDVFIILSGNIHAGIEIGTPFDPNYQPMSYLLHTLPGTPIKILDIRAIQVRYAGGNIWACMGNTEADCKTHQMNPPPSPYSSVVSYNRYFLSESLSNGYNATLFERTLTASPPAFQ